MIQEKDLVGRLQGDPWRDLLLRLARRRRLQGDPRPALSLSVTVSVYLTVTLRPNLTVTLIIESGITMTWMRIWRCLGFLLLKKDLGLDRSKTANVGYY